MSVAYYIEMQLDFPEGVHFGAGKQYNSLVIARDGTDRPVLNGTSFAGVIRTIWRDYVASKMHDLKDKSQEEINQLKKSKAVKDRVAGLFGRVLEKSEDSTGEEQSTESLVKVTNYELQIGEQLSGERTHHLRNRHRGTVVDGGLFTLESCPPGTFAKTGFWVYESAETNGDEIERFLSVIIAAFQQGVCLGGSSNRGIGRAEINQANVRQRIFDLRLLDDQAAYLDAHRAWRLGNQVNDLSQVELLPDAEGQQNKLNIDLTLVIPRGQDILVGDGQADEVQIEPQRIKNVDGNYYWRIPGSSLRGLVKRWCTRLAAREKLKVDRENQPQLSDSAHDYRLRERTEDRYQKYNGDNLGWCFKSKEERKGFQIPDDWIVTSLFGSLYQPGRIKISDGFAPCSNEDAKKCSESQLRMHVAVDRVTGGAAEGMLFDNRVLVANGKSTEFRFRISVTRPEESEIRWLAQTLVALDLGILRIGSSKSSGRLSIKQPVKAEGPLNEAFLRELSKYFDQP